MLLGPAGSGGGGAFEGGAGGRGIEQIAFQIDDGAVGDQGLVDVVGEQLVGGAQEGRHRPLAVGQDVD